MITLQLLQCSEHTAGVSQSPLYDELTCNIQKLQIWNGPPVSSCIIILLNSCLLSHVAFEQSSCSTGKGEADWLKEGMNTSSFLNSPGLLHSNANGLPWCSGTSWKRVRWQLEKLTVNSKISAGSLQYDRIRIFLVTNNRVRLWGPVCRISSIITV